MSTSDDLTIQIDSKLQAYHPGDTIRGILQLRLEKDSPVGKVIIQLRGYTKSKIVQPNGQSTSKSRGRVELFKEESIVHNDHFTHKSGVLNWPFKFRIPATTELSSVVSKWKAKDHFLDTSGGSSLHPLPPTFRHIDLKHGKTSQATVTYGIEAIVEEPSDVRLTKPHVKRTVQPIYISKRTPQYGIDVNDPQQRRGTSTQVTIKTLRLLPENRQSLSMAQKMSSMFSSSKLPRFAFEIDVSYPSVLQISHPAPILFVIAASPKTDPSSTTIQPSIHTFYRYPSAHVKHLKLWLEAHTDIRCPSLLSDSHAGSVANIPLIDCGFTDTQVAMRSLAWDQKNKVDQDLPMSIDFGRECNARLKQPSKGETKPLIAPSFMTYNISRRYYLVWVVELECASEKRTLEGRSREEVTVIGPTDAPAGETLPDTTWLAGPNEDHDSEEDFDFSLQEPPSKETLPAYSELPDEATYTIDSAATGSGTKR